MKEIKGYENYLINEKGEIFSKLSNKILRQNTNGNYLFVVLMKNGIQHKKKIHRLIVENFIKKVKNKNFVNHKDGNKLNNNILNLEWCTHSENIQHAYDIGLIPKGINRHNSKLTEEDVEFIKNTELSTKELLNIFYVHQVHIDRIKRGTRR